MKIYLAASYMNEEKEGTLFIPNRLLSYFIEKNKKILRDLFEKLEKDEKEKN